MVEIKACILQHVYTQVDRQTDRQTNRHIDTQTQGGSQTNVEADRCRGINRINEDIQNERQINVGIETQGEEGRGRETDRC